MPGQSFLQLGLDVSGFDDAKKKRLNEFIALFDKLSKYDGKVYSPVIGGGLAAFNKSIKETSDLLSQINTQINSLNAKQVTPIIQSTPAVSAIKNVTVAANGATTALNNTTTAVKNAGNSIENTGKNLTGMYSKIRQLAYILPGIGIAGIFNLAFEAISGAAHALVSFGDSETFIIDRNTELNKSLNDSITLYEKLEKSAKAYQQTAVIGSTLNLKRGEDIISATGDNKGILLQNQLAIAQNNLAELRKGIIVSERDLSGAINSSQAISKPLDELYIDKLKDKSASLLETIRDATNSVNALERITASKGIFNGVKADDKTKPRIEEQKSRLSLAQNEYDETLKIINLFESAKNDIAKKEAEIAKFNADEARKLLVETTKSEISVILDKNKQILSSELSTSKERINAAKEIEKATKRLDSINKYNITANNSSTPSDVKVAIKKASDEDIISEQKREEEILKIQTEFYQRNLKAKTELNKAYFEKDAIENEKAFNNENNSLSERLDAYKNYVLDKQKLQELELNKDLQKGASKQGGKTALTLEEEQALVLTTNLQKSNLQADAEKKVYDIVYSSLRKQLKAVEDEAKTEDDLSKESYTKALEALNAKNLSYDKYQKERRKIDEKYRKEELQASIVYDEIQLDQLKRFKSKRIDFLVDAAEKRLDIAKAGGNKLAIDSAQGELEAAKQVQVDVNKDIKVAQDKLNSDKLKLEKEGPSKGNNKGFESAIKFELSVLEATKKILDEEYAYRVAHIERLKKLTDEQYTSEINAIEKSSLSQKDKTALDIQLNQQKLEADKAFDKEQRKIKYDQAVFDKAIAIAKLIAGIAIASVEGKFSEAAEGVVGLAAVASSKIPEYKYGTKGNKHKGGFARTGEGDVPELILEPYKSPYFVTKDNISYLPPGTDVIPFADIPEVKETIVFGNSNGWEQTRWLAKQFKKSSKQSVNNNIININLGNENYKRRILGR
jgi:hypothetical protein